MALDKQTTLLLYLTKKKGAKALYEKYLEIRDRTELPTNEESVEYLKAFVQHDYKECIRIVREKDNKHLTLRPYEDDYIHFVALIAAYYLDTQEYVKGLLWAMKAVEVCDLLYPTMKDETKHTVLREKAVSDFYFEFYPKYPIQNLYNNFYLDWEAKKGFIEYNRPLNDN